MFASGRRDPRAATVPQSLWCAPGHVETSSPSPLTWRMRRMTKVWTMPLLPILPHLLVSYEWMMRKKHTLSIGFESEIPKTLVFIYYRTLYHAFCLLQISVIWYTSLTLITPGMCTPSILVTMRSFPA